MSQINFVTVDKLLVIGCLTIREGAVGVIDEETGVVAFRNRDVSGSPLKTSVAFTRQQILDNTDKLTIEPGM